MLLKKKNGLYFPTKEQKKQAWVSDRAIYKKALQNPLKFWEEQAKELKWQKKWTKVFDFKAPSVSAGGATSPSFQWFKGGKLNITESCLDENISARKNKVALFWEPEPETETPRQFTYQQLFEEVNKFSSALKRLGVKKGDRVGIYLPMIPEAIIAMLSCARVGAVHSVVFSAFSSQALKVRLKDTGAKVLITADGYYRRGKVIDLKKNADLALKGTKVEKTIIVRRANNKIKFNKTKDFYWDELTEKHSSDFVAPVPMDSEDPLFILYTSGCCDKDTFIQLDTGEVKKIYDLVEQGGSNLINTSIDNLKQNIEPIINKFRYSWDGPLWKIQTALSILKVTSNHSLFVWTKDGKIIEKPAAEVKLGEHILQSRKVNVKGKKQKMPVFNINYHQNKATRAPSNKPIIAKFLTPGLAQILGYCTGDGGLRDANIYLTDKDKNNLLFYQDLFQKELKVRGSIKEYSRKRLIINSAFLARYLKGAFPEIFIGSRERKVPKIVQKSNNQTVAAFIRGFFDAEGTVTGDEVKITSTSRDLIEVIKLLLLRFGIVVSYFEEKRKTKFSDSDYIYEVLVYGISITDRQSLKLFQENVNFSDVAKSKKLKNLLERLSKKEVHSMINQLPINGLLRLVLDTIMVPKAEANRFHLASYIYSGRRIKQDRIHLVVDYIKNKINLVKSLDFSQRGGISKGISIFKLNHNDLARITGKSKHTVHQYHNRKKPLVKEDTIKKFYAPISDYLVKMRKEKLRILESVNEALKKIDELEYFDFFEVKKSEPIKNDFGFVYDLETLKNHNYIANGVVVHNSTGRPKGTVQTCGGYAVQAKATGKYIFDWKDGDVFWSTADLGWITGHSYSCYSPLLSGITFLIYEGAPDWPSPDRWAKIIEKYGVTIFYTAPTAIRMFLKYGTGWVRKYKFSTLRLLGSVGEPIDESAWRWYFREVGKGRCPLVDTWWQTETGGILITSLPGIGPFKPSFTGLPFPGLKTDILDDKGKPVKVGQEGNLVLLKPFSPGLLRGIYRNPAKYLETYWSQYGPKIYFTSDAALRDKNWLIRIVGRTDDVIKIAGHRLTTGELENAINSHPAIAESAVIGRPDEIKGEAAVAFVVPKAAKKKPAEKLKEEVIRQVRKEIGPIASPREVYIVDDLPKTRSGKIMRRVLKRLFTGEPLGDLSTLANPQSVAAIKKILPR